MREAAFRSYLTQEKGITSKVKAVISRVAKALVVEQELRVDLDDIVADDDKMYQSLILIQEKLNDKAYHGTHQNAVRKYYLFVNNKNFPTQKQYEKRNVVSAP